MNYFGAINAIDNALAFARAGRLLDQTAIDQLASVRDEINTEFPHDEDGKPIEEEKVHKMTAEEFALLNVPITEHTEIFLAFTSGKNYFDLDPASSDLDVDLDEDLIEKLEDIGAALTPRNVASGDLEIDMPKREIRIHVKTLLA